MPTCSCCCFECFNDQPLIVRLFFVLFRFLPPVVALSVLDVFDDHHVFAETEHAANARLRFQANHGAADVTV